MQVHGRVIPLVDEAFRGGPIAAVRDGDTITIDVDKRALDVDLTVAEIDERVAAYVPPANPETTPELLPTVAINGLLLVHVPAPVRSVSVVVVPAQSTGVPEIVAGSGFTVMALVALQPPLPA